MRNHLKMTALLVSLMLVISLTACTKQNNNSNIPAPDSTTAAQTGTQTQSGTNMTNDSAKKQYTFINGALLGSYDNSGWHSLCNTRDTSDTSNFKTDSKDAMTFYAKDLLNQDSYYVYDALKQLGLSKQIIWQAKETSGLGCFEDKDAPEKFLKYGKPYSFDNNSSTGYRIFDLPIKLGDELSTLKIPNYSFDTEFVYGEKWERRYDNYRLVTSSNSDLYPRTLTYDIQSTSKGKQVLIDLFKEKNMENTVPNFKKCVKGDLDNDGKEEYLMIADAPRSEMGYPLLCSNGKSDHLGTFNVILYQDDNDSTQIIYSDLQQYKNAFKPNKDNKMELLGGPGFCTIDLLTAADINSDGIYEIGVDAGKWESGSYMIFAMNSKGEYEVVMRSNYGM